MSSFKSVSLLALVLACALASANARAKAEPWDSDEDMDGWFDSTEEDENEGVKDVFGKSLDDHAHHNHQNQSDHHGHAQKQMNAPSSKNWGGNGNQGGGMQSSNFASFNESCGPQRKSCAQNVNLVCSDTTTDAIGRCICAPGYVYVRDTEHCWPIPKSGEDTCGHDIQCHAGKWGNQSSCSKHISRCECYDYLTNGKREMILAEGVCYVMKTPGDLCRSHDECNKTNKGEAYCQPGNHTGSGGNNDFMGACKCMDTHVYYNPLKEILKIASQIGDPCVISSQCRDGTLGKYSKCRNETARCECWAHPGPDNTTEAVYYRALKKCFVKIAYNETCGEDGDDQCRASLGPDVECGSTDEYPDEDVCHCPKGRTCRASGFSTVLATSSTYTIGVACTAAAIALAISKNGFGAGLRLTSNM